MEENLNPEIKEQTEDTSSRGMSKKQWYVVNTFKNKERAVKESLEKRREAFHLENNIFRIVVAEKTEDELDKNDHPTGKQKTTNFYEGYVFIEMIMSDEAWYVVRNTPDVSGFVGSSGKGTKPFPMSEKYIKSVLKRANIEGVDDNVTYEIGEEVKFISGTFQGTTGFVESVDYDKKQVNVKTILFAREYIRTADFAEIEKVKN